MAIYTYTRENIVNVYVYIRDPYVKEYLTSEKITYTTFAGTVGGLMGLFLGFSFISGVELCYHFFMPRSPKNRSIDGADFLQRESHTRGRSVSTISVTEYGPQYSKSK